MIAEPLPRWLQLLAERMHTTGVFGSLVPNHVLVNEYLPGQGIMPHEDGPFFSPVITTINLGSHCVIKFYRPRDSDIVSETANGREGSDSDNPATTNSRHSLESRRVTSLFLEPNSLLVLREDMYTRFLHGIEPVPQDSLAEVRATCANAAQCPSLAAASDDVLARSTRVSLTIRHAPNTIKLKFKLGGK
ncbi:calcium-dependent cysteine protease, variant [Capsaspora owczarzaki ATCC 30864]|nr:calcium-dependent cysteine protease, variant [Capsaspora owczarzaki ATCC 30864]